MWIGKSQDSRVSLRLHERRQSGIGGSNRFKLAKISINWHKEEVIMIKLEVEYTWIVI